jgi:ABC-type multidrug transport system fused ATPase/permease subunit
MTTKAGVVKQIRALSESQRRDSPARAGHNGLDTQISARAVGPSGGQRQRVGIAQTLLVDSPVVLLDEPTVGLDAHADDVEVQALTRLMEGLTVSMPIHQSAPTTLPTRNIHLHRCGVLDEPPPQPHPVAGTAR